MGRRNFENLELVIAGVGYYLSVYTQTFSSNEETILQDWLFQFLCQKTRLCKDKLNM